MSEFDRGRNAGLTGLVDLPTAPGTAKKFQFLVHKIVETMTASADSRAGRGDTDFPEVAYLFSGGSIALTGEHRMDGYFLPDQFRGQTGTVTIQHAPGKTQTIPVLVTGASLTYDDAKTTTSVAGLTCTITGNPTFTGFGGTQGTADVPTGSDKELWAGLAKSIDPGALQDTAVRVLDVWSIADTDAAEVAKIAALLAAASPPITGLKLRPAGYARLSARRSRITLTWGRTSTADDVLNPRTIAVTDPRGLTSINATAAMMDPAAPPSDPSPPSGMKLASREDVKLNDGKTARVYHWALVDSKDEKEFEQTKTLTDANGLTGTSTLGAVFTNGSPPSTPAAPSGLKLVNYYDVPLTAAGTSNQSLRVFAWGTKDSRDELLNPRTTETQDPKNLQSKRTTATLIDPASPPATPAAPSGYKFHHAEDVKEVDGTGTVRVYHWGLTDALDEVEFEKNETRVDPNGINSRTTLGKVFTNGSPPSTPASPSGQKLLEYFDAHLTAAGTSNQSVRVFRWAVADSVDAILNPKNTSTTDPRSLKSTIDIALFSTASAPSTPAGYKLAATLSALLPEGKTVLIYRFALTDSKDDAEFERTRTTIDPNGLESATALAAVFTTGSPPSTPSTPSGQKLVETFDVPLTAAGTSNQSVRVWRFGTRDSADAILNPKTRTLTDPQTLEGEQFTAVLFDPGSPPSDPTTPDANLKLSGKEDVKSTDGKWYRVYHWTLLDSKDRQELPRKRTLVDANLLDSEQTLGTLYTNGSPPSTPAAPSGLKLDHYFDVPVTLAQSLRVYRWGVTDSKDRLEMGSTAATGDPLENAGGATATEITCLATDTAVSLAATAFAANQGTAAFAGVQLRKITPTRALQIIKLAGDDKLLTRLPRATHTHYDDVAAESIGGYGTGPVYVKVAELPGPLSAALFTSARLAPRKLMRSTSDMHLRRRIITTTGTFPFSGLLGKVNDATFLAYPPHTVMFGGVAGQDNWALVGGGHLLLADLVLHYDSLCHPNDGRISLGWNLTSSATTYIASIGDVQADTYFGADKVMLWPTAADFSVLLA